LADALKANSKLTCLLLTDNSIGDVGAAALARALATNRSLWSLLRRTRPPGWGASVGDGRPTAYTHCLPCHSSVVVAQLLLNSSVIGDSGISALVGALAANGTLKVVCDGRRSVLALISIAQLGLGILFWSRHPNNTLSEAGARALVPVLRAARARPKLNVCPDREPAGAMLTNALLASRAFRGAVPARPRCERCHAGRAQAVCSLRNKN